MLMRSIVVKIWPSLGLLLLIGMMGSCSLISQRKAKDALPIEIDLNQKGHPFFGMGANVPISFYNRRTRPLQVLNDLKVSHIRVKRSGENWNDIAALRAATFRLKIKWVYSLDKIPATYLDESGRLADIDGFAYWWAEEVDELNYQEVPADMIELIDNPEIANAGSPIMNSDDYNRLIHATRRELDLRDYQDVAILGPGLSTLSTQDSLETWYMDLDQEAFEMLPAWSGDVYNGRLTKVSPMEQVSSFKTYLKKIESVKPIFLTSYRTQNNQFGAYEYPDPERYDILGNQPDYERYYYSASFSMPYALDVYANTLEILSQEQVIPFVHQLFDAPDLVKYKKQSWGLLDLNGTEKPAYTLLAALLSKVPKQARIVSMQLPDAPGLSGLGFINDQKLLLSLCHENLKNMDIRMVIKGGETPLEVLDAEILSPETINDPDLGRMDAVVSETPNLKLKGSATDGSHTLAITLKPNSVFIVEIGLK